MIKSCYGAPIRIGQILPAIWQKNILCGTSSLEMSDKNAIMPKNSRLCGKPFEGLYVYVASAEKNEIMLPSNRANYIWPNSMKLRVLRCWTWL